MVIGRTMLEMGLGYILMPMETNMKVNLEMICLMDKVLISMLMELRKLDFGRMMNLLEND
jgi:hypothetical protein